MIAEIVLQLLFLLGFLRISKGKYISEHKFLLFLFGELFNIDVIGAEFHLPFADIVRLAIKPKRYDKFFGFYPFYPTI
jgi:hypothetical protein